jgi:hypothetical protein
MLSLRTWITLKSSVVIFQVLEPLQPHWPHQPLTPCFIKEFSDHRVRPSPSPKWPIMDPICWIDHEKSNFLLISDVGGCWGQPILLFWTLDYETQMSNRLEATRHHNSIKWLILLPLRPINVLNFYPPKFCFRILISYL